MARAVDPRRQGAVRGDRRVLLAERARGRVARVRRELLIRPGQPLVQLAEAGEREVDLAAHLDHGRRAVAVHSQRDRLDRSQVRRHVLPLDAVAPRGASHEDAVLVREVDGEAVDLRLDHPGDVLVAAEPLANVVGPLGERLVGRHLLQRAHRLEVPHLLEPVGRGRADPVGRRVRREQLGVGLLERDQLVVETVVLGVRDRRVVEDVVLVEVAVEQPAQLGGTSFDGRPRGRHRARRRCRRPRPAPPPPSARACGCRPR